MKKLLSLLLAVVMICSVFTSVSAADARTYGADNLNSKSGDLIIGYIGGSITEGAGATSSNTRYSTLVVNEYFKKNYPGKNVIERNASIGGTGSDYGNVRMRNDLKLDSDATPDVVFIEFAVNDIGGGSSALTQNMESMVRQLLALPKIPVIMFVYTTRSSDSAKTTRHSGLDGSIAAFKKVADNYGIYELNLDNHIWNGTDKNGKKFTWANLSNDGVHPNDSGYRVYADFIVDKLNADKSKAFVKLDPTTAPCGNYVFGELKEVPLSDPSVKKSNGWKYVENIPADPTQRNSNYPNRFFTNGYYATDNCVGETIELEFTGRGFGIDLNRTKNSGTINWTLYTESGAQVKSGSHTNYYKTDGGRCCGGMLATNLEYGKYKLVITGAKNQTAVNDNNANSSQGGTGTYLGIESIVIEKAMPVIIPSAENIKFTGVVATGGKLTASYDYSCKMYKEGKTEIKWYQSSSENGSFEPFATGKELALTDAHKGKYIKLGVTPVNEQGTAGETVYTHAVYVTRPVGKILVSEAEIKVDGADSDVLKPGKNTITVNVTNTDGYPCTIAMAVSLNNDVNGVKSTTAVKTVTKTVANGLSEDFTVELDIDAKTAFTEGKILVYATDNLEPSILKSRIEAVEYVGASADGADVYRINRFE